MYWKGGRSCLRQWKQPFILTKLHRIWKCTRARTSINSKFIQYHAEIGIGKFWRDSECEYFGKYLPSTDESDFCSRSSDLVDKSKSTCLLRLRSVFGKMSHHLDAIQRSEGLVEEFQMSLLMENYRASMEKQLNSSGTSSRDLRHCRFFRRSGTPNLRNSQIG